MSKFVIISLVAVFAVVNARGLNGDVAEMKTNEVAPLQQEGRLLDLITIPALSTIVLKSLKMVWFLLSTVCSVVDYKLAALALAVNTGIWLLSFKFPVLVGAALMLGFCKVTGLCAFKSIFAAEKSDHLSYAEDYLDMGTLKYGKSS